jgi:hypothetical protein
VDLFSKISSGQNDSLSQINLEGGLTDRQKKLILAFIIVLILTGAVLYFGFFSKSSVTQPETAMPMPGVSTTIPGGEAGGLSVATGESQPFNLEGISLDFSVLNSETFKGLQEFGSPLDLSGEKGRENPFVPY